MKSGYNFNIIHRITGNRGGLHCGGKVFALDTWYFQYFSVRSIVINDQRILNALEMVGVNWTYSWMPRPKLVNLTIY